MYDAGLLRRNVKSGQISVLDTTEEWYNAYEKDIAVANFYYSKPTSIGKNHLLSVAFLAPTGAQEMLIFVHSFVQA